jgi:hypothetical protein
MKRTKIPHQAFESSTTQFIYKEKLLTSNDSALITRQDPQLLSDLHDSARDPSSDSDSARGLTLEDVRDRQPKRRFERSRRDIQRICRQTNPTRRKEVKAELRRFESLQLREKNKPRTSTRVGPEYQGMDEAPRSSTRLIPCMAPTGTKDVLEGRKPDWARKGFIWS